MKLEMVALTAIVLTSLSLGCEPINTQLQSPNPPAQTARAWSAEQERETADLLHEEAARLDDQVAHLEQRIERFNKKPHLDPKGFKRRAWKRRMEAYRAEIAELHERIAWHHKEADRLKGGQAPQLSSETARAWSAEEHREAADLLDEDAVRLEAKVAHLEQRIERFNNKPSMDPKEIKRQEWKALIKAHRGEIAELREQILWHHEEVERLSTMPASKTE